MEKPIPIDVLAAALSRRLKNLNPEIGALDRMVDKVLERNLVKKPCQRVELEEVRMAAGV